MTCAQRHIEDLSYYVPRVRHHDSAGTGVSSNVPKNMFELSIEVALALDSYQASRSALGVIDRTQENKPE